MMLKGPYHQQAAKYIEPLADSIGASYGPHAQWGAKWTMWATYWWWQGICWAGIWTLGHEVSADPLWKLALLIK